MQYKYKTHGTCSRSITLELDGDIVRSVNFEGGCNGNLKGISKLVEGMPADKIEELLSGTTCGLKKTSCPDQLAKAVREALEYSKAHDTQKTDNINIDGDNDKEH